MKQGCGINFDVEGIAFLIQARTSKWSIKYLFASMRENTGTKKFYF